MATITSWDDGKHSKVKSVRLTHDGVINSIEVVYDGTSLQSQTRGTLGPKSNGFTLASDEYMTEVTGYYKTTYTEDVITALTFKTNKRTYGPYGNKTRNFFSVTAPKDNQIVGFLGSNSNALISIDVHFSSTPSPGSTGSKTGGINTGGTGGIGGSGSNTSSTGGSGPNTDGIGGSGSDTGCTGGAGSNTGGTKGAGSNTGGTGGSGSNTGGTGGPGSNTGGIGGAGSNIGGTGGAGSNTITSWDDGKHSNVKSVQLTHDDVINSIEVVYGGTSLQSQRRGTLGPKSDGFTLASDEYITEVTGYYKTIYTGDVITALTFKTNKKTYGPYGNKTRNFFSVTTPKDNQIAGFLGSNGNALISIDVHFSSAPTPGITGSNTGGANTGGTDGTGGSGPNTGGIEGSISNTGRTGGSESNTGGTGGPGSNTGGTGRSGSNISGTGGLGSNTGGIGGPGSNAGGTGDSGSNTSGTGDSGSNIEGSGGSTTGSSLQKLEAKGGTGGNQWDDGANHEGVTNIYVAAGGQGINQIKFDYVTNGEPDEVPFHGVKGRSIISPFEINHPNEYLLSVKGWYDSSNIIQGIQFITNTKTSDYFGYEFAGDGTEFSLQVKDKNIVGFHGFAESHLNSLGAYFAPITSVPLKPVKKLQAKGGEEGATWDDGVFDGVIKIDVGQGTDGVSFVMIKYNKGSQIVIGDGHGKKSPLGVETFELDPDEYIIAMEGYYDRVQGDKGGVTLIQSLIFKTNKQTSQPYGLTGGEHFELKEEGHKIVGFYGKAGDVVHSIGVYVAPITN